MKKSSAALIFLVAASLVAIGVLALAIPRTQPERKGSAEATVVIDFGGQTPTETGPGTSVPWSINVSLDNGTVFGALQTASRAANFTFNSEWYPNFRSHRVNEIAGVHDGTDNRYWQYYVNGQYLDKGADLVGLSDGDVVKWEFRSAMQ
jgi:hypothetical protein